MIVFLIVVGNQIANFQAPRYFLKPGAEWESYKKHSPDSGRYVYSK